MTQISRTRQADYASAITTALVGGTAWGVGQYVFNKKPFMNVDGNLKDSFIKTMEESLVAIKDKTTLENIEYQKTLEKEIDALKNSEELKEFIKNKKGDIAEITDDEIKLINEELGKMEIGKSKEYTKKIFKSAGKYETHYRNSLEACYNDAGQLIHDAKKITKEKFDALSKNISKARINSALKSAATFMAICGVSCCIFEFLFSNKKSNKK